MQISSMNKQPFRKPCLFFNGINLLHQKAIKSNTMEQNQIQFPLFILKILKGEGKA